MDLNDIKKINLKDYNYNLPAQLIAQDPLADRSSSRLLVAVSANRLIHHSYFNNITDYIPRDSFLILNNTKVFPARIELRKETGGSAELLCIEPIEPSVEPSLALSAESGCKWVCFVGGRNIKPGSILFSEDKHLEVLIIEKTGMESLVEFSWKPDKMTFSEVIEKYGHTPLPPYLKRADKTTDKFTYQTVYAKHEGSAAAPTAGLHFTEHIFEGLKQKNVKINEITLHVGPGTFKPIESDSIGEHVMHSEMFSISVGTIKSIINYLKKGNRNSGFVATGTTSLRTLESLYWLGVKSKRDGKLSASLNQWDCYLLENEKIRLNPLESLEFLCAMMEKEQIEKYTARTQLFIVPGYNFRIIDTLITNFHLPQSTLILLVAAFAGKELWKTVYHEAISRNYRFLSYGDASLIFGAKFQERNYQF